MACADQDGEMYHAHDSRWQERVHIVLAPIGSSANMRVLVKQNIIREDVKSYW